MAMTDFTFEPNGQTAMAKKQLLMYVMQDKILWHMVRSEWLRLGALAYSLSKPVLT